MAVRARGRWLAALAFVGAGTSAACSLLFDTDAQCTTTSDCLGRGAAFASTQCVDNLCVSPIAPGSDAMADSNAAVDAADAADSAPDPFACGLLAPPDPDPTNPVTMTLTTEDFTVGAPAFAVDVRLCAETDALCTNPRTTLGPTDAGGGGTGSGFEAGAEGGTGWVYPAKDGTIVATVETGFEGFFEIRSFSYFPTIRFTSPPLRNKTNDLDEIMLRPAEIQFFADQAAGHSNAYDAQNKGLVFTLVRDCNQNPLAGVSFSTTSEDPAQFAFYIVNTTPSTQETKTDATGRGGFANVPPGLATFTAYFAATGVKIGATRALIRAGYNTTLSILPSPIP